MSINNRFIVEPYGDTRTMTATTGTGFAMIKQKVTLKALKLLVNAYIVDQAGQFTVPAGNKIYVREELLYTQPWAKQILEMDDVGKCIVIDRQYVEAIEY